MIGDVASRAAIQDDTINVDWFDTVLAEVTVLLPWMIGDSASRAVDDVINAEGVIKVNGNEVQLVNAQIMDTSSVTVVHLLIGLKKDFIAAFKANVDEVQFLIGLEKISLLRSRPVWTRSIRSTHRSWIPVQFCWSIC